MSDENKIPTDEQEVSVKEASLDYEPDPDIDELSDEELAKEDAAKKAKEEAKRKAENVIDLDL